MGVRRDEYAALGIPEYWRFDNTGEDYGEKLAGEILEGGTYRPLPVEELAPGVQGYSFEYHAGDDGLGASPGGPGIQPGPGPAHTLGPWIPGLVGPRNRAPHPRLRMTAGRKPTWNGRLACMPRQSIRELEQENRRLRQGLADGGAAQSSG